MKNTEPRMIERSLLLPVSGEETFFLWGARQTGKSTLLRHTYPDSIWIDLLKAEEFRRYLEHPEWLRQEILHLEQISPFIKLKSCPPKNLPPNYGRD